MSLEAILYETHCHTPLCKHASGDPEAYAAAAERRGLKGLVVTCHNPGPNGFSPQVRMSLDQFDEYVQMVERARVAWQGRIDVRLGIECDYIPEMEPFLVDLLRRAEFHYVLGSIHPQLPYYRERFDKGDADAFYQTYFDHLACAAETGLFDALAHPDLVKNVYFRQWNPARVAAAMEASLDRIAATGVAMELNTSGLYKTVREMNPNPTMLAAMRARDIPVVVGSDAHTPGRVAADFPHAYDLLEESGYEMVTIFLDRQPQHLPLKEARASLK